MGKFVKWIKKKLGISQSNGLPGGPPPRKQPAQVEIEKEIDRIVSENLPFMGNLINYQNNTKFWQDTFKALASSESNFDLDCRYVEPPSLGKDVVTGKQNTSEGLLQMSYQDSKYHSCDFDWSIDKNKSNNDSSKTIFNIENNIKCGMIVMNKLVGKKGTHIFNSGNYWAVLKPDNKRHAVYLRAFNQYQRAS